ncbi:hypothetical protein DFR29_11424 [Tahibacter aquaticus]|uniref:Nitrogen fixation protein FixH n=1 Tax=Tahibacter aquaticus TaxID=520092 RepID=A0A4R6YQ47_9GAMM|nr:FixH family protein [Tahibacter aquaticus]TDR39973.1 hypothetical protein DFR29_11424 [Tahibacter aquaticus]
MNSDRIPRDSRALRQPVFWLVLGLPLLGIVAGIGIVVAAVASGGSDALSLSVRRTAQIQTEDTAADLAALQRGLRARLQLDKERGVFSLQIDGTVDAATQDLQLRLLHPLRAQWDRQVTLARSGDHWQGRSEADLSGAWNLRLQPADASWRLGGRLDASAVQARLQPLWQQ